MSNYLCFVCATLVFQFAMEAGATSLNVRKSEGYWCYGGDRGRLVRMLCPGTCFIEFKAFKAGTTNLNVRKSEGYWCYGGDRGRLVRMLCPGTCFIEFKVGDPDEFGCYVGHQPSGWFPVPYSINTRYQCNEDFCNNKDVKLEPGAIFL